ncbi:hypothetical protein ACLK2A_11270 [Escherichia coli]
MTNLKKRERAKTNASLISMVQRFSDITIMFAGLWLVCEVSGLSFLYMHLLVALITLVVFQMLGGITDFYRSWRGVRQRQICPVATKLDLKRDFQRRTGGVQQ